MRIYIVTANAGDRNDYSEIETDSDCWQFIGGGWLW